MTAPHLFDELDDAAATTRAAHSVAAFIARRVGGRSPALSAQRILEITANPAFRVQELLEVLETDPALTARILQMVNSGGAGLRARCRSLQQAITLLGASRIRHAAMVSGVLHIFEVEDDAAFRIREHSTVVATLARWIGDGCNLPGDELFTCGALHDLGKMMLLEAEGGTYTELLDAHDGFDRVHLAERAAYEFDHAVLAAHVLEAWKIPAPVPAVVAFHHRPDKIDKLDPQAARMVHVLRLADRATYLLGSDAPLGAIADALADDEAARALRISREKMGTLVRELQDLADESRRALAEETGAPPPERVARRPSDPHAPRATEKPAGPPCAICQEAGAGASCPRCARATCATHAPSMGRACVLCETELHERRRAARVPRAVKLWAAAAIALAAIAFLVAWPALAIAPRARLVGEIAASAALALCVGATSSRYVAWRNALRVAFLSERGADRPAKRDVARRPRVAPAAPQPPPPPARRTVGETPFVRATVGAGDEMTIDVVHGPHAGKRGDDLSLAELRDLLARYRRHDPPSASLIETYLDHRFTTSWRRDDAPRAHSPPPPPQPPPSPSGALSREEAYRILDLRPGANADEIRNAYKRLVLKMHPDQGGSTYLASQINRARDVLLG